MAKEDHLIGVLKTTTINLPKDKQVSELMKDIKKLEGQLKAMNVTMGTPAGVDFGGMSRHQLARYFVSETGEIAKLRRNETNSAQVIARSINSHRLMLAAIEAQYTKLLREGYPLDRFPRNEPEGTQP